MGRNDRKHSDVHKAAVVHAYEHQGMTGDQIVTLAAAGQLKAPDTGRHCKPFEIAASTVLNYVNLARRRERRAGDNGGHDEGPAPNETVTMPAEKPSPAELLPVTGRPGQPRPGQPQSDQPEESVESILQRLLRVEQDNGDTTPPPPPD